MHCWLQSLISISTSFMIFFCFVTPRHNIRAQFNFIQSLICTHKSNFAHRSKFEYVHFAHANWVLSSMMKNMRSRLACVSFVCLELVTAVKYNTHVQRTGLIRGLITSIPCLLYDTDGAAEVQFTYPISY